jgi:hypothetical protein
MIGYFPPIDHLPYNHPIPTHDSSSSNTASNGNTSSAISSTIPNEEVDPSLPPARLQIDFSAARDDVDVGLTVSEAVARKGLGETMMDLLREGWGFASRRAMERSMVGGGGEGGVRRRQGRRSLESPNWAKAIGFPFLTSTPTRMEKSEVSMFKR